MQTPNFLQPDPRGIPPELKGLHQWVGWKAVFDPKRSRWKKVPINPHTGGNAKTTDPSTWSTFEHAFQRMGENALDGIGFVFAREGDLVGIDLDGAVTPQGIAPWAQEILKQFETYTELSVSGTGLHLILRCTDPPEKGRRQGAVEVYSQGRYFTMTGQPFAGERKMIRDCTQAFLAWHEAFFTMTARQASLRVGRLPSSASTQSGRTPRLTGTDQDLLNRCRARWPRFGPLYDGGDLSAYDGDHSSADLALLTYLAHAGVDTPEELERFFDTSGLDRKKWRERPGYRERTIAAALNGAVPLESSEVDDPVQLRRRITDLEAQLRATEDRLVDNSVLLSQYSQIRGNRGLPQARVAQSLLATFRFLESTGATPPYRIWIKDVALASGVHRNTAGRHIKTFAEAGLLHVKQVPERRPPNPDTGELLPPQTVTYMEPVGGIRKFAKKLAIADLRPKRGEEHPRSGPIRRCWGEVRGRARHTPNSDIVFALTG